MMAAGGLVAAVGFAMVSGSGPVTVTLPSWGPVELPMYRLASLSGLGLGLAFLVVVWPRDLHAGWRGWSACRSRAWARRPCRGSPSGCWSQGLLWSSIGWVLLGLSQLAVVRAMVSLGVVKGLEMEASCPW